MKVFRVTKMSRGKPVRESTKVVSIVGRRAALLGAAMTQASFPFLSLSLSHTHPALALSNLPGVGSSPTDTGFDAPVLTKPQTVLVGAGTGTIKGPSWLEGTWDVSPELVDVTFPMGKQRLRKNTPGVTKVSEVTAHP